MLLFLLPSVCQVWPWRLWPTPAISGYGLPGRLHRHRTVSPDHRPLQESTPSVDEAYCNVQDGKTYARLRFNVGLGGQMLIPVCVDYTQPFGQSSQDDWEVEYKANIKIALQLASIGVPWLQLVDYDLVEPSNLAS